VTRFPLTGAHRATSCEGCHADRVYRGKPMECQACHRSEYDGTSTPPHAKAGFSTTCTTCHNTTRWEGAVFDHAATRFPLTGAHRTATCEGCHADGVYAGKPTDCISCHTNDYNGTRNPPHASQGFPTTCASCHTTTQWTGATFDHDATRFALTGAHRATSCGGCHGDGVFRGKPTTCFACHGGDYSGTTNPHHAPARFATDCATCHTTTAWQPTPYDHNATSFPLTGAHRTATCTGCHSDRVYDGKPTDCYSCHTTDYSGARNPDHRTAQFPTTCVSCHTTTAWQPGTFDHSATRFPLTGAHRTATCNGCHADGVYRGKTTDCYACHTAEYNGSTNPNHRVAMFPTTCVSCHNTARWQGATFDHDARWFPIYSGKHQGKWSTCTTCHTSPSNYKQFTCFQCHEHSQQKTDADHQGEAGYRYDSNACYACHPRGTH
jgi:hypothetical protein